MYSRMVSLMARKDSSSNRSAKTSEHIERAIVSNIGALQPCTWLVSGRIAVASERFECSVLNEWVEGVDKLYVGERD